MTRLSEPCAAIAFAAVAFVAAIVSTTPSACAQTEPPPNTARRPSDLASLKRDFESGLRAKSARARVNAIASLAAATEPASLPWMLDALEATVKRRAKHHKAYEKLGRQINEKTSPRVPLSRGAQDPDIADLQIAQQKARRALSDAERVLAALRKAVTSVVTNSPADARGFCTKAISRATYRARNAAARAELAETLGYLPVEDARAALMTLLRDKSPEVRIAAATALGRQKASSAVAALQAAVDDTFWQVRATAIQALGAIGGKPAVDALIIAIAKVEGRLIEDVRRALTTLTGQNFHDNRVLWRDWWLKHRADYDGPPAAAMKGADGGTARGGKAATRFYGIETRSKRLIYILDLSGSMNYRLRGGDRGTTGRRSAPIGERKVDQAIMELKNSITALPNDATFNIVFYNHDVAVWRKKQITATDANKQRAIEWAEATVAMGNTNIFDALERAFRLAGRGTFDRHYAIAADTFYLLSDGRANRGRVTGGMAMRNEVRRLNKFRKVVVHSIALGNDANIPFMRGLAQDSGGQFVHVGFRGRRRDP